MQDGRHFGTRFKHARRGLQTGSGQQTGAGAAQQTGETGAQHDVV